MDNQRIPSSLLTTQHIAFCSFLCSYRYRYVNIQCKYSYIQVYLFFLQIFLFYKCIFILCIICYNLLFSLKNISWKSLKDNFYSSLSSFLKIFLLLMVSIVFDLFSHSLVDSIFYCSMVKHFKTISLCKYYVRRFSGIAYLRI